jgi:hypothetical protein
MPSDSGTFVDVVALWPLGAAVALAVATVVVLTAPIRAARRIAVVGIGLTALAAAGLWLWLLSDATRYDDGSTHLDHMTGSNLALAAAAGAVAIALGLAALRSPSRRLLAAALAVSALACLAQTYGFLGYTTTG